MSCPYMFLFPYFVSTANVSKQIMARLLLSKYRPHGSCLVRMKPIKTSSTPKTRDDLIYTFEDGRYKFYAVDSVNTDVETYCCTELNISPKVFRRHEDLDFGRVGVFQHLGRKTITRDLTLEEIHGKLYSYKGLVMSLPVNILTER